MRVEAVVFDIGNVLIEWNPERFYDATIGEIRRREMFTIVDLHEMNDRVDRGAPFKETIYETAEQYPDFRTEIRMWFDNWIEMASPEIPHSTILLRALQRNRVPVFALSNFGIGSFEYAETIYPVLGEFDRRYVSGYMKVVKPDATIYQMLEDDCGVAPGALLFADDRDENISAASARGWQTHLFEHPSGWADRLVAEGLLNNAEATP